ncbi:hypothetical protein L1N85_20545 [Paenibacillus alkaliterrae]|uniref:hypothetical protein n=1 Tax=Paenibacillus alkaliterrae TaxID=320909 RepID=UPI001F22E639|nr:hypothetical protein [Paenibacillus alkaliterrae]MCF2940784.1 hypothetical protein [Paenibacillus alkaliterrae]
MAINRRLSSDQDFEEMIKKQLRIRVFQDNQIVDASSNVVRFNDSVVVTQSGVSDIAYHDRKACEFFELRRR